jgi:hypothetical protein
LAEQTPKVAEIFPNWPISPKSVHKKETMGRISANLDDIRPKSVAEIKLRAFDRF